MFSIASIAEAQTTAPETQRGEKWRGRPLPPSLQSELRQLRAKQGSRAIVYRDTVRASQLARAAFNDSTAEFDTTMVFEDSALSVVDSGVSLTHKEWLDSLLVEIPEISRFSDRIEFNYPLTIQTEPIKKPITVPPVDVARINPIPKENLPYFDQSPIPWTLSQEKRTSGYLTAGGGSLHLPLVRAGLAHTLSERLAFDLNGSFLKLGEASGVRDHYGVNAKVTAELGLDAAIEPYQSSAIEVRFNTSGKKTDLRTSTDSLGEHSLRDLLIGLRIVGDVAKPVHYDLSGSFGNFTEQNGASHRESRYNSNFAITIDPGTDLRLRGDAQIDGAGSLGTGAESINATSLRALAGQRALGNLEWYAGARIVSASDALGSRSSFMPQGFIRLPLNPRWEIGGSYEPSAVVASNYLMSSMNPFFSRTIALQLDTIRDARRVMIDRINVAGFMNYMLSADDQIRTEVRYIERNDEPVFDARSIGDSASVAFVLTPRNTRRMIISSNANFLLFKRDVVTAGIEFRSATDRDGESALPFEPVLRFTGAYSFNSIAPYLRPIAEFHYLSREDHAMSFINLGTEILFGESLSANVRVENLFNSQGDFWQGYNERPRAVVGSLTYKF
ncbi:MAG TPA: hypothetical protein VFH43_13220 [Candidatus Kapabacteria bacterium]|nr:hypothetical protein [Candidatus Kapabacteria bacterium]